MSAPRTRVTRESAAAMSATIDAVASFDPSSRTSTASDGTPDWPRTERSVVAMCASSSRAGMRTVTGSSTSGACGSGRRR